MELIMPFLDNSHSFSHGFQCGQVWELINSKYKFNNYLLHTKNIKQVEMMLKRSFYEHSITKIDKYWCYLNAEINLSLAN